MNTVRFKQIGGNVVQQQQRRAPNRHGGGGPRIATVEVAERTSLSQRGRLVLQALFPDQRMTALIAEHMITTNARVHTYIHFGYY